MKIEVYIYEWTHHDFYKDEEVTSQSQIKVTREFVEDRKRKNLGRVEYRIVEDSKELVEESFVVDGKYHPELESRGFQRQVG